MRGYGIIKMEYAPLHITGLFTLRPPLFRLCIFKNFTTFASTNYL